MRKPRKAQMTRLTEAKVYRIIDKIADGVTLTKHEKNVICACLFESLCERDQIRIDQGLFQELRKSEPNLERAP